MDDVAKELKIRTRIMNIYNKTQDEFDSKEAWDDYLEMVEDVIYCLVNNVDVQQAEGRISDYERSNRLNILANQAKKAEAERIARAGPAAAALAASAAAASNAPEGYVPSALVAGGMGRQPVPVQSSAVNSDGSIGRSQQRLAMGSAEEQKRSAAAGWSPDLPHLRAMQEAFGSFLI